MAENTGRVEAHYTRPDLGETIVAALKAAGKDLVHLTPDDLAPKLCSLAAQRGWKLRALRPRQQTLEDLFVRITGEEESFKEATA